MQKQNLSYEQLLMEKSFLRFCTISNEDRHIQNDKHVVKFNHSTLIKHGQENEWVIQFAWHSVKIPYYCLKTGLMIKQFDPPLPSLSLFLRHQLMPNKFHQQKRVNAADIIPVEVSF